MPITTLKPEVVRPRLLALTENLAEVIRGKQEPIEILTIALLAGGSVLMEDVPGVGKTTLAKTLARSLDAKFRRIQFTPDLLPTDILGSSVYNPRDGSFEFREGPIFCSVLLADEINRASPRTQSALLEAMSEGQVTIDGERRRLPHPFIVLATQNPIEFHGTYPLPEAQLDRFLVYLNIGYPDAATEVDILYSQIIERPVNNVQPVVTLADVQELQAAVKEVQVERTLAEYIIEIVQRTREHPSLRLGVSPRGSLMLFRAVQAAAYFAGRDYVMPDDIQRLAPYVLAHRTVLTSKARHSNTAKAHIINEIVESLRVPV